jgi:hypothetical protein
MSDSTYFVPHKEKNMEAFGNNMSKNNLQKRIKNWLNGNSLWLVLMIAFFIFGVMPQVADSQIVRKKPPTVTKTPPIVPTKKLIFEGRSIVPAGATDVPLTSPLSQKTLTMEEKKAALIDVMKANGIAVNPSNFPVAKYAVLTARTPYFENKAYFYISSVNAFIPERQNFMISSEGGLYVWLKPDRINGIYMIDCNVYSYQISGKNAPYRIYGPDQSTTEITLFGNEHLQMFMISKNLEWQTFYITRSIHYDLGGCEITLAGN